MGIQLNKFILSRAGMRARRMSNPDYEESAVPFNLVTVVANRTDALRAAEELYAMAICLVASFAENWVADLSEAVKYGADVDLEWHERLVIGIESDNRSAAIEALAHLQWMWGRHFFDDHGWNRSAARHTQRLADWLLGRPNSVA